MDSGAASRKRGWWPEGIANGNGAAGIGKRHKDMEFIQSGLGSKSKPCTKFFSMAGCPFGEGCHFMHYVPGGIKAVAPMTHLGNLALGTPRNHPLGPPSISDSPITTPKVKGKMCNKYNTAEGCRFGDKCNFAHGERELGRPVLPHSHEDHGDHPMIRGHAVPGRPETAAASFGASATAKISVDASLAGAIIGKGGVNTKQICRVTGAKLSIRDHDSDPNLRNIELEGTFEQIGYASTLVKELIVSISSAPPALSAKTALPVSSGPPTPQGLGLNYKTKPCDNFNKGSCTFGDRCHFAHGASELRKAAV